MDHDLNTLIWQQQNARNISARARANLFAAIECGPDSEWVARAISDQKASAKEYARARDLMCAAQVRP